MAGMIIKNQYNLSYCFFKVDIENVLCVDFLEKNNINVIITIDDYDFSIQWKLNDNTSIRRYFLTLSNYPEISNWELYQLYLFIKYESKHMRKVGIWCADETTGTSIKKYLCNTNYDEIIKPNKLTACTACNHNGCLTDYVMHIASIEDSKSIFRSGKLLSAYNIKNIVNDGDYINKRNAAGDPIDYSDYIMLSWANCQAGDRIVVERKIGHGPDEEELKKYYEPAPRFYFKYSEIIKHNNAVFDGYHPVKIKDELLLFESLHCCIISVNLKEAFNNIIGDKIKDKIIFLQYSGENIWDWSEKCYKELLSKHC